MGGHHRIQIDFRAVNMTGELDAVIADTVQCTERKHLVAAAVGQNRPVPAHQPVQIAERFDHVRSRPQQHVVRIGQHDLRPGFGQLPRRNPFHAAACAHRHKYRCLDRSMRRQQTPAPGLALWILFYKLV